MRLLWTIIGTLILWFVLICAFQVIGGASIVEVLVAGAIAIPAGALHHRNRRRTPHPANR